MTHISEKNIHYISIWSNFRKHASTGSENDDSIYERTVNCWILGSNGIGIIMDL
jgi:hypothetical protein